MIKHLNVAVSMWSYGQLSQQATACSYGQEIHVVIVLTAYALLWDVKQL